MNSIHIKYTGCLMVLLCTMVISLVGNVYATPAPVVATLEPIMDSLRTPVKMALDNDGSIYVADPRSGGIVVLNQYGQAQKVIPTPKSPSSVALLNNYNSIPGGKILVGQDDFVAVLDKDGVEIAKLGSGIGQFVKTAGIAVAPNGTIYVVDAGAYNVKVFSPSGSYSSSIGSYGTLANQFLLPTAVTVISETNNTRIAVVDTIGGKVVIFDQAGNYKTIGSLGTGPLRFNYPVGVTFEYVSGALYRMYVVDMFQGQVQAIDPVPTSGLFLSYISSYGSKPGNLLTPSDLLFDPVNKRLLVANGMSNIVIFGIDNGTNPTNTVAPVLTIDQASVTVNAPSIVLAGTVDAGCTLTSSANTPAITGAANFPSASAWTILVEGLQIGSNTISITAKNSYGTTTTKTATVQYTPPGTALSINSVPSLTTLPSIMLTGSTEPGSKVYVSNAASSVSGQADVAESGSWTYNLTLTEGPNSIDVAAVRPGSAASYKSVAITLDSQAPLLTISASPDGSSVADQIQNISGKALDPNLAGVTVNGNAVPVNNGLFSYALSLVKGPNVITIAASDSLGHTSTTERTIIFEPALPVISIASPADGAFTNQQDVMISGTVDQVASIKVNGISANPAGGHDWSATVKLATGMNTIEVTATDSYGAIVNQKRTIVYDATAPDITITSPTQDAAVKSPGLAIKGIVGDNNGIKSIRATVNGVDKLISLDNGEFTLFADFAQEGTYSVAISITDLADNVSTALRTLVYDITPPALTVDPVLVPYPYTLSGTVEVGANLVVKDASGSLGLVTVEDQHWNADLTGLTYDAATLAVLATDAAGNESLSRINVPVPDGDIDVDGRVTIKDALTILRLVVLDQAPTTQQLAHGDVGPLLDGKVNPKGRLEIVDAILILRKALGLSIW